MSDTADVFAPNMAAVAEKLLGKPNKDLSSKVELRYGNHGSLAIDLEKGQWYCHEEGKGGGVLALLREKGSMDQPGALDWMRKHGFLDERETAPKSKPKSTIEATFDYVSEKGEMLFQVVRFNPKKFAQRHRDEKAQGGWEWSVQGVRSVPYRLPELLEALALDRTVFIVEGEKCVEALRRINITATCNAGGAGKWQAAFGEHFKGARVVILPDNDVPGRNHAVDVAAHLAGVASVRTLELPGLPAKGDIVDWLAAGGTVDELWDLAEAIPPAPLAPAVNITPVSDEMQDEVADEAPAAPPPLSADALLLGVVFDGDMAPEPPRYLVKNLVPAEGVTILGGQSGAGKTFLSVDLATSLATGAPFFGRRVVERVGTLILAAEGAGTIASRVIAARIDRADVERLPIAWLGAVGNLADAQEVAALQPKIRAVHDQFRERFGVRLGLIVIDTLAAAFALRDENDAAEAQGALRHMRMLGDAIGAVVLPVHHYGKNEDTGLRGSSAYRGGADAVLSVLAERNQVTGDVGKRSLNLAKTRYGEEGPIAGFGLRFVELGTDEDGDPFGACVVAPELDIPAPARAAPQKDPLPIVALKGAFDEVMIAFGREVCVRGDGPKVRAVTIDQLRPEFRRRYATGETDAEKVKATIRQAFKRALSACSKHGFHTAEWGGEEWLWRINP